jgi:predicted DNA-binding WGR domain protein
VSRRFEKGTQFWEVACDGFDVSLWFGDIGRGKSFARSFASAGEAQAYVDKQIAQQLAKGFVETASQKASAEEAAAALAEMQEVDDRLPPKVHRPDDPAFALGAFVLERARAFKGWNSSGKKRRHETVQIEQRDCRITKKIVDGKSSHVDHNSIDAASRDYFERCDDLYRLQRYGEVMPRWETRRNRELESEPSVHADWLLGQRDARGEIAARHLKDPKADLAPLIETWFPDFSPDHFRFELRDGFIVGAKIAPPPSAERLEIPLEELVARFLGSPLAVYVERLELGPDWGREDWNLAFERITSSGHALRVLVFRADPQWSSNDDDKPDDHLTSRDWSSLESLESLEIAGRIRGCIGKLDLPLLRTLAIRSSTLYHLDDIVASKLPKLERLELSFRYADRRREKQDRDLDTLFSGKRTPALRHLAIHCGSGRSAVEKRLETSKLFPRLESHTVTGVEHDDDPDEGRYDIDLE